MELRVGEIIYPPFDPFWRHNERLGGSGWHPILVQKCEEQRPGPYLTRVIRDPRTPLADRYQYDKRMEGKLMSFSGRGGLVVFIKKIDPALHLGEYRYKDWRGSQRAALALILDPPNDVWALKVVATAQKYAVAEPIKLEALP